MTLYNINGRLCKRNTTRFRIHWIGRSRSQLQFKVKQLLKSIWFADIVYEEFPVFGTLLHVDFFNATKRKVIEVNGPQHEKYNPFFHNGSHQEFVKGLYRDLRKYDWCEKNNIQLVQIIESDLDNIKNFYNRVQL